MTTKQNMKYIHRVTTRNTLKYWKVQFSPPMPNSTKIFEDWCYGGRNGAGALQAAIEYRDSLSDQHLQFCKDRALKNTGKVLKGINLHIYPNTDLTVWRARVASDDGRPRYESFSIRDYGYIGAYALARAARLNFECT
jgi:hypothetical protein